MNRQQRMMPGVQPGEPLRRQSLTKGMSEMLQQRFLRFAGQTQGAAKPLIVLLIGFLGVAGLQRSVVAKPAPHWPADHQKAYCNFQPKAGGGADDEPATAVRNRR